MIIDFMNYNFYMKTSKIKNYFGKLIVFSLIALLFNSCGIYKKSNVKDNPINDKLKREKNINEGKGIRATLGKKKSGQFDFATSNEMWRASIEVLDFVPLSNVDYGGGIIITDWFSNSDNSKESIKISVQFLTNEIRVDGLKVKLYKKNCNIEQVCNTKKIETDLNTEIKLAILKKAAQIKRGDFIKSREGKSAYEATEPGSKSD